MSKRIEEVRKLLVQQFINTGISAEGIQNLLVHLPEFKPLTWNDPKVLQPKPGKYIALNYGSYVTVEMRSTRDITCPWHYVNIAPLPEPDSELVEFIRTRLSSQFESVQEVIVAIKEFEAENRKV